MGRNKKKHKTYKDEQNLSISKEDVEELQLLNIQIMADLITIVSSYLSYISTIEGIQSIYSKYNDEIEDPNPEKFALQSSELLLIAIAIYSQIGFTRYEHLNERKSNGDFEESLTPDMYINIGNLLSTIAYLYYYFAAIEFYRRESSAPVFGI